MVTIIWLAMGAHQYLHRAGITIATTTLPLMTQFLPFSAMNRRRASNFSNGVKAFSLVELLVVMVILAILLIAAAPMFLKTSARARQTSREIVKGHLMRARSHSIATGGNTAVIFADYAAEAGVAGKMLGIAEVEWKTDTTGTGKSAYRVTNLLQRWEKLPGQVMFLNQKITGNGKPTIMEETTKLATTVNKKAVTGTFIVFAPSGEIIYPADKAIEITLGSANLVNGTVVATEKTGNTTSYDLLQVNRLTGRARLIENQ
jgi:prepilin-type N-terminal cleavage/methylation domain-containing protein